MRIEIIPLILGVFVALLGVGIIFDAWTPDVSVATERRRRPRLERHRNGEALIGFGVLALAAAFLGRDSWRYSVLVVIIGAVFLVVGAALNGRYVRELFVNRGPLRRRVGTAQNEAFEAVDAPSATPTDAPAPRPSVIEEAAAERRAAEWDGVERRSEPREGPKRRPSRRSSPPEDSASGY